MATKNNRNVQTRVYLMQCPHCHSENTRRFSVIYDDGTKHQKTVTTTDGLIAVGKDIGSYGGTTETETTSHTTLARRCQPPKQPSVPAGPIWRFFTSFALGLVMAVAVLIVVGIVDEFIDRTIWEFLGGRMESVVAAHVLLVGVPMFMLSLAASRQKAQEDAEYSRVYPGLRAKWERAWLCMKCGRDYEA